MHHFLLLTLFAAASAEVFYPGPCPRVQPMENFDFARYQGIWYEVARYPNAQEEGTKGKCTTAEYIAFGDVGKVTNTQVVDGIKLYVNGALTLVGPAKVRFTYTFGDRFKDSYLTVLKTDYINYSLGYSCKYFPENNTHQVFSWIKSRTPNMDQASMAIVNRYIQGSPLLEADKYISNDYSPATCSNSVVYEITDFRD